jgi:hypothetical protein
MRNIRDIRLPAPEETSRIGKLIYQNECGGQEKFLIHWNIGEEFMSLGIGHFIWYPVGVEKKFTETFPLLLRHFITREVALPEWLDPEVPAPWADLAAFRTAVDSDKYKQLLILMKRTFAYQVEFMSKRFADSVPVIVKDKTIAAKAAAIATCPDGMYLLIDYLNFKGAGTAESEQYAGQGWGLMQVLASMEITDKPKDAFAAAAEMVLKRRIANSPSERGEERWLPGWLNRIATYRR